MVGFSLGLPRPAHAASAPLRPPRLAKGPDAPSAGGMACAWVALALRALSAEWAGQTGEGRRVWQRHPTETQTAWQRKPFANRKQTQCHEQPRRPDGYVEPGYAALAYRFSPYVERELEADPVFGEALRSVAVVLHAASEGMHQHWEDGLQVR